MKTNYSIFYSWQSDSPKETNQIAIRHSLRDASNKIEHGNIDTHINIDEATKNKSGSPDIATSIFDKIEACDVFICDLTTINSDTNDKRHVPNPNVLIELGFAIATVGWDRIIMLFNKAHGVFPDDLPFDIDRRRVTTFTINDKFDKSGMGQLTVYLEEAIRLIIKNTPLKPSEKIKNTPAVQKRELDIKNLKLALCTIHTASFDEFIDKLPDKFLASINYHFKYFTSTINRSAFYIYDEILLNKLNLLSSNWAKTIKFEEYYIHNTSKYYYFLMPPSKFLEEDQNEIISSINQCKSELINSLTDLLKYVRQNYLEIDIDEASEEALYSYYRNKGRNK